MRSSHQTRTPEHRDTAALHLPVSGTRKSCVSGSQSCSVTILCAAPGSSSMMVDESAIASLMAWCMRTAWWLYTKSSSLIRAMRGTKFVSFTNRCFVFCSLILLFMFAKCVSVWTRTSHFLRSSTSFSIRGKSNNESSTYGPLILYESASSWRNFK